MSRGKKPSPLRRQRAAMVKQMRKDLAIHKKTEARKAARGDRATPSVSGLKVAQRDELVVVPAGGTDE